MSCSHNIIFINQGCLMTTHLIPDHEEKTYRTYCFYGFHVISVILFKISYIFLQYPEHKYQQFDYFIIIGIRIVYLSLVHLGNHVYLNINKKFPYKMIHAGLTIKIKSF